MSPRTRCVERRLQETNFSEDFYLTLGEYDAAVVIDAPDDETVAKASLAIGSLGNVRIETLRAFTEDEYRRMIGTLP